jgi:hypothetical protein
MQQRDRGTGRRRTQHNEAAVARHSKLRIDVDAGQYRDREGLRTVYIDHIDTASAIGVLELKFREGGTPAVPRE